MVRIDFSYTEDPKIRHIQCKTLKQCVGGCELSREEAKDVSSCFVSRKQDGLGGESLGDSKDIKAQTRDESGRTKCEERARRPMPAGRGTACAVMMAPWRHTINSLTSPMAPWRPIWIRRRGECGFRISFARQFRCQTKQRNSATYDFVSMFSFLTTPPESLFLSSRSGVVVVAKFCDGGSGFSRAGPSRLFAELVCQLNASEPWS